MIKKAACFLYSFLLIVMLVGGCADQSTKKTSKDNRLHLAFVVNLPDPFWSYARAGCYKAEQDFNVKCDFKIPFDGSSSEQNRILETLIQQDTIKGIAVSPLDPKNQTEILNDVAAKVKLVCHDSDAPDSNRLFYLGTNNYSGGRQVGKLIKETLPDGGQIMIYVGKMDVLNAQQRREGVIDELKEGVSASAIKPSGLPSTAIMAGKYIILDTRTDQGDRATAKKNAENTLKKYPSIDAMVGLWAYNVPQCLEALKDVGMEGKIRLISFDEDELTLQGIKDGYVHGTVVQQPYEFGYQSVKYLKALIQGDTSMIPENKQLDIPTKVIKKDNVEEFWANLKALQKLGEEAKKSAN
ncbi:ABC transporter substrate-binding protein [Candidatus Poribacteria bacterium]|jgi:ribose transport system substrate-binding protein|nr:ABC transporter substrate-binding protein [Candidatus Poribacteria bacterium]